MARTFLAIDLPEKVKKSLANQLELLKKLYPQFSWVYPEDYHITIYFHGEVVSIDKTINRLKDIIFNVDKLYFYSTNLSLFINSKIIIYLNFKREKNLENLVEKIENSFKMEKPGNNKEFVAHLTLARAKIPSKQQYLVLKKRLSKTFIDLEFAAHEITLFESFLGGRKPHYEKKAQFTLG